MLWKLVTHILYRDFDVVARRYTVPPNKQPVFSTFTINALSNYDACREFDQTHTAWTRLSCTVRR